MTREEATEIARRIFSTAADVGESIAVDGEWIVTVPGDPSVHRLTGAGRVGCGHPRCLERERHDAQDAIAADRFWLRSVHRERLGSPSQVEIVRAGRVVGLITTAPDGITISGLDGYRLAPGGGRIVIALPVRFEPFPLGTTAPRDRGEG